MDSFKFETNFKDLNLGKHFAAAKGALKNLKKKIEEFRGFNKDGLFIHDYFSQLRNEIDIEREMVKLKIEKHYLNLIAEVNDLEDISMSVSTDPNKSIEDEIKAFEKKLESFRIEFEKLEIDNEK